MTITAPTYTTSPFACDETVNYTVELQNGDPAPNYVTIANKVVSIITTNTALSANVSLNVKVTRSYSGASAHKTQNHNFTLSFTNPCATTTLNTSGRSITAISVALGSVHTSSSYTQIAVAAETTYSA